MNLLKHKTNQLLHFLPFAFLFLLGTFYLYYFTSYIFFYQEKSILFQVSFDYLRSHLNQPGGFLVYLSELQATFYYYPLLGALLVTLEICLVVYLLQLIGTKLAGRNYYFLPFLIGAVFFYLQTSYQYLGFNSFGILIQLVLFYWFINFKKEWCLWLGVVLFPVSYFLFGSFSILLLTLLSVYFIQKKEWVKITIVWIISGLFFFIGKEFLFFQTTLTLFKYPFNEQNIGGQIRLFMAVVTVIALLPILFQIEFKRINSMLVKKLRVVQLTPFVVIAVLAFLVIPQIDKKHSHYFHVEKLFYQQKYDEIIRFNSQFPSSNILTSFLNNVALAEAGQLSNSFLSFPQTSDGRSLFLKWEMMNEVLKRGGYFYYSLGMINEAQRWAYEYMVMHGNSPEVLKMIIKTDLIKGKYTIAEKYIAILEKSVFYRANAREFRNLLNNETAIKNHPEYSKKRNLDTRQDFFVQAESPWLNLDYIIEADSANIPAIEYKLAWMMLNKDVKGVVGMLPLMEKAGYKKLPKNVEEVVVAYKQLKVGELPQLHVLKINPHTEQRFQQFYRIFQQNSGNKQLAQKALVSFSDTHWYYVFFNG